MTVRRVDYADEIVSLQSNANQAEQCLVRMTEDLSYVVPAVNQLKELARDYKPPREDRGYLRINPNDKVSDPREEGAVLARKLRLTLASLDRAAELLAARRAAIAELLR